MKSLICILGMFLLSGCDVAKMHRIVDPIEALRICGDNGVSRYSAISGNVRCNVSDDI